MKNSKIPINLQFFKFAGYGFFKNLKFFDIFILLFFRETGLSFFLIGLLYTIREITVNLLEIPSGIIADSIGRKRILLTAFVCYQISFLIFYLTNSFKYFIMAIIFFGMGEACRSGTHKAMILRYLKRNNLLHLKSQYYGATRSWSQLGSAVSSLMAIPIVFYYQSYHILFLYALIPYTIDFLLVFSYPSYLNYSDDKKEKNQSHRRSLLIFSAFQQTFSNYLLMIKNIHQMKALLNAATYNAFFKTTKDYLQPLIKIMVAGVPILLIYEQKQRIGIISGLIYFILFLLTSNASRNAWRLKNIFKEETKALNFLYFLGIGGVALSGICLMLNLPICAILIFCLLYLALNLRVPLTVSYISDKIKNSIMASGLSTQSQLETIIMALYAPLLGFLADSLGTGGGLFVGSIIFALIGIGLKLKK